MEFSSLVKERYSVRKFSMQPVEEHAVAAILEAARMAPTACNNQPQRILVVQTPTGMEKLKECTKYTFGAPMALVVCYQKGEAWVRSFDGDNSGVVDASIVSTHIMLAVHDLGLGSTWVGYFDPLALRKLFNLPDSIIPVAIFPIGHLAPDAKPASLHDQRRPLTETVVYESF